MLTRKGKKYGDLKSVWINEQELVSLKNKESAGYVPTTSAISIGECQ